MSTLFDIKWTRFVSTKFIEFGFDPDNNRYLIGISSEVELSDGSEKRIRGAIHLRIHEVYLRVWLFRTVLCIGSSGLSVKQKDRLNFKLLLGIGGE